MGYISLLMKGSRVIYLLLSLECLSIGVLIWNLPLVIEVGFILILTFTVVSSVLGLLVLVSLISTYGSDIVQSGL